MIVATPLWMALLEVAFLALVVLIWLAVVAAALFLLYAVGILVAAFWVGRR